ncbi:MAG: hypothetical protein ACYC99_00615 [Candidatus Geothermincolia bacterium]
MVGESIKRVRRAEEKAEDTIEAAAEEVERVEADASRDYSMMVLAAIERARKDGAKARAQALKQAEEEISVVRKDADWERSMIALNGRNRMDEAVAAVLEILEGFGTARRNGG